MNILVEQARSEVQMLHDNYNDLILGKDEELEKSRSKIESLEVKVAAYSKGAERASSTYSGEGTEHVSNAPRDAIMAQFAQIFQAKPRVDPMGMSSFWVSYITNSFRYLK